MLLGDALLGARGGVASPSGGVVDAQSARHRFGARGTARGACAKLPRRALGHTPQCCAAPPAEAPPARARRAPRNTPPPALVASDAAGVRNDAPPDAGDTAHEGDAAQPLPSRSHRKLTTRRKVVSTPSPVEAKASRLPTREKASARGESAPVFTEPNELLPSESSVVLKAEVLTALLAGAKTSERVLRLTSVHMARLNAIHVAAALDALGAIFLARRSEKQVAAAFANDERTTALLELASALAEAGEMAPRDLVACIRGCARLSHNPGPPFLQAWERAAVASAARFRTRDVAGAAWAYGQLRLRAGPAWTAARDALYEVLAPDMRPEELAAVFWGHGRMQSAPRRVSRTALCAAAAAAAASDMLAARELANVLWGAAGWAPVAGTPSGRLAASWAERVAAAGQPRLREATGQELSNIAWALPRLGAAPERSWRDAFYDAFAARMRDHSAKPQHLAATLYALSQLAPPPGAPRGVPEAPPAPWMAAFWEASRAGLQRSSGQQLANTVCGAARLRVAPPPEWYAVFWRRSALALRTAPPTEVAATLAAAAALQVRPPQAWQQALWAADGASGLRGGSCAEVSQAAQALAALKLRPPERWLAQFASAAARAVGTAAPGEGRAMEALLLSFLALLPEEGLVSRSAAALPELLLQQAQRRGGLPVLAGMVEVVGDELVAEV